jgi:hypothetical protein
MIIGWDRVGIKSPIEFQSTKQLNLQYNQALSLNISRVSIFEGLLYRYELTTEMFRVPKGYWDNIENRKHFMNQLGKTLGFKTVEDWYKLTTSMVKSHGGSVLLMQMGSISKLVSSVYPDHNWIVWKFNQVPKSYWKVQENQQACLKTLEKEMNIRTLDDWYVQTVTTVIKHGGGGLLRYYGGSLTMMLDANYPKYLNTS